MLLLSALKGIHAQVSQGRSTQHGERLLPNLKALCLLLEECHFPVIVAQSGDTTIIGPIDKFATWPCFLLTLQGRSKIVAVKVNLVVHLADLASLEKVLLSSRVTCGSHQGGQHVFVCRNFVIDRTGLDHAWPLDHGRHAITTFPVSILFAAEHGRAAVGPSKGLCTVICRVHDDGVFV